MNDSNGNEVEKMDEVKTIDTSEQEVIAGGVELGEEEKAAETQPEETGTTEEQAEEKVISVDEIPAEKIENPMQAQLDEALAKIEELNASVAEKASALIEAQKQINELTAQIAELAPYREAAEQAAREKAEAERKEKVDALRAYAEESGMVSKEELESGEIAEMIENLKETELKVLICDRIVAKQKTAKPAETAQKHNVKMKAEINFHEDTTNPVELFRKYING
jgi:chromosome segregation ATPase